MNHNKVLFVHIPKTGGRSIFSALSSINYPDTWERTSRLTDHDAIFNLEKNNNLSDTFIFSVVRNPFTRAFSHYIHVCKRRSVERKSNISFTEFLHHVRCKGNSYFLDTPQEYMPLAIMTQAFYLHDRSGTMSLINKIYRFENLNEFEKDFNTQLPVVNVGNYSKQEYLEAYSKENMNLVRHIYFEDFAFFNYSTNFDDSIK